MKKLLNWIEPIPNPSLKNGREQHSTLSKSRFIVRLPSFSREGLRMGSIKAFSIIETITAMALLTITFGIAISTFDIVMNTDNIPMTVNANLTLKQIAAETKQEKTFYDETIERNGFTIQKIVQPYEKTKYNLSPDLGSEKLIHLQLTAQIREQETIITTLNTLLLNHE
jgi:hypothetical protein